jgi:hypothetical protein
MTNQNTPPVDNIIKIVFLIVAVGIISNLFSMVKQTKTQRFKQLCDYYDLHLPSVSLLNIPNDEKAMVKLIEDLKILIKELREAYYTQ